MDEHENLPTLADQLRDAVTRSGLSIYAAANAAGIPEPVLHRFMRGQRDIRLETAVKLARCFGMKLTRPKKPKGN